MNSLFIIHPYRVGQPGWAFDDPEVDLVQEPFVAGADNMITEMVKAENIDPDNVSLIFSDNPFPTANITLNWLREDCGGNWYKTFINENEMEGWLCPALFKYLDKAPKKLYVQLKNS